MQKDCSAKGDLSGLPGAYCSPFVEIAIFEIQEKREKIKEISVSRALFKWDKVFLNLCILIESHNILFWILK